MLGRAKKGGGIEWAQGRRRFTHRTTSSSSSIHVHASSSQPALSAMEMLCAGTERV